MKQDRLKNDKRGWDVTAKKVVRYSWVEKHGGVFRAMVFVSAITSLVTSC